MPSTAPNDEFEPFQRQGGGVRLKPRIDPASYREALEEIIGLLKFINLKKRTILNLLKESAENNSQTEADMDVVTRGFMRRLALRCWDVMKEIKIIKKGCYDYIFSAVEYYKVQG